MLRLLLKISLSALSVVTLAALHVGLSYIAPYPFSKIHIIFLALVFALFIWESGAVVWLAFFTHVIIDLYSATPFGILIFSATIAMLLSYWSYQTVFTNRSFFSVIGLTVLTLILYRVFYSVLLFLTQLLIDSLSVSWSLIGITFAWELLLTSLGVGILFLLSYKYMRQLNPKNQHMFYMQ